MRKRNGKTKRSNYSSTKRRKRESSAEATTLGEVVEEEEQGGEEEETDEEDVSSTLGLHLHSHLQQSPIMGSASSAQNADCSSSLSSPKKSTIRPRKVNIDKPLLIFRPREVSNIRAAQKHVLDHAHHCNLVGTFHLTQKDMTMLQDCTPIVDKTLNNLQIPIPRYNIIDGSVAEPRRRIRKQIFKTLRDTKKKPFRLPKSFIPANSLNCMDIALEYDMKSDDENWLIQHNKNHAIPISETDFERIYALAERCASLQAGNVSVSMIQFMNNQVLETQSIILRPLLSENEEEHLALLFPPDFSVTTVLTSQVLKDCDVHQILGYWKQKNEVKFKKFFEQEKKVAKVDADLQLLYLQRQVCERAKVTLRLAMEMDQDNKQLLLSMKKELQQCVSQGVRHIEPCNLSSFQTFSKHHSSPESITPAAMGAIHQTISDTPVTQQDHPPPSSTENIDPKQT